MTQSHIDLHQRAAVVLAHLDGVLMRDPTDAIAEMYRSQIAKAREQMQTTGERMPLVLWLDRWDQAKL